MSSLESGGWRLSWEGGRPRRRFSFLSPYGPAPAASSHRHRTSSSRSSRNCRPDRWLDQPEVQASALSRIKQTRWPLGSSPKRLSKAFLPRFLAFAFAALQRFSSKNRQIPLGENGLVFSSYKLPVELSPTRANCVLRSFSQYSSMASFFLAIKKARNALGKPARLRFSAGLRSSDEFAEMPKSFHNVIHGPKPFGESRSTSIGIEARKG